MSSIEDWDGENVVDEIMKGYFKHKPPFSELEYVELATAQLRFMCELLELHTADKSSNNFDIKINYKKLLEFNENCMDLDKKTEFLKTVTDYFRLMTNLNKFSIEDNSKNYEHH